MNLLYYKFQVINGTLRKALYQTKSSTFFTFLMLCRSFSTLTFSGVGTIDLLYALTAVS